MQPEVFNSLNKVRRTESKQRIKREEKMNIKELMQHRYYRRGRGGTMKQVR